MFFHIFLPAQVSYNKECLNVMVNDHPTSKWRSKRIIGFPFLMRLCPREWWIWLFNKNADRSLKKHENEDMLYSLHLKSDTLWLLYVIVTLTHACPLIGVAIGSLENHTKSHRLQKHPHFPGSTYRSDNLSCAFRCIQLIWCVVRWACVRVCLPVQYSARCKLEMMNILEWIAAPDWWLVIWETFK